VSPHARSLQAELELPDSPSASVAVDEFPRPSIAGKGPRRAAAAVLVLAVLVYVALRAAILHTDFDAVCMPSYELGTIGNLAEVTLEGRGGAPLDRYFDNVGGHLIVGLLAVPFYALFGASYLSLKLVPFALGLATLLVVWRLLRAQEGALAAAIAALLFALAPPLLCKYSLIAKGNHFENLFFQLLAIAAFCRVHSAGRRPLALFGLAAGFAVTFYTGSLLTLSFLALVHILVRGPRAALGDALSIVPAFAVGIAPLFALDLASDGRERSFLRTRFLENRTVDLSEAGSRLVSFFVDDLPKAGCFEALGPVAGRVAGLVFLAAFACAWVFLAADAFAGRGGTASRAATPEARRFERWKLLPFLLHLPAMAVLVSVFDFPFKRYEPPVEVGQYRYLVPHFAFAIVLIAVAAARACASRSLGQRLFGGALAASALATGLFTLPVVDLSLERAGRAARYEGCWYPSYANVVLQRPPFDPREIEREIGGFDPVHLAQTWQGVSFAMAYLDDVEPRDPDRGPDLDLILARFPDAPAIDLAHGVGSYLRVLEDRGEEGHERLRRLLAGLERDGAPALRYVVEGLALDFKYPLASRTEEYLLRGIEIRALCPPALRLDLERGLGIACGRLVPRAIESDLRLVHRLAARTEDACADAFCYGIGWGACESREPFATTALSWSLVPRAHLAAAVEGFGAALRHQLGEAEARAFAARLGPALPAGEDAALERGLGSPDLPSRSAASEH
jgi:hypothetical protein